MTGRATHLAAWLVGAVMLLGTAALAAPTTSPEKGEAEQAPEKGATVEQAPIDLNSASAEALGQLPGIGPKKVQAIIARRERKPFTRVTQLLEIRGIGHKTLLRLKPRITVLRQSPTGQAGQARPAGAVSASPARS